MLDVHLLSFSKLLDHNFYFPPSIELPVGWVRLVCDLLRADPRPMHGSDPKIRPMLDSFISWVRFVINSSYFGFRYVFNLPNSGGSWLGFSVNF